MGVGDLRDLWREEVEAQYARARDSLTGDLNDRGMLGSGVSEGLLRTLEEQKDRVLKLLEEARLAAADGDRTALLNFGSTIPTSWSMMPLVYALTGAIRNAERTASARKL